VQVLLLTSEGYGRAMKKDGILADFGAMERELASVDGMAAGAGGAANGLGRRGIRRWARATFRGQSVGAPTDSAAVPAIHAGARKPDESVAACDAEPMVEQNLVTEAAIAASATSQGAIAGMGDRGSERYGPMEVSTEWGRSLGKGKRFGNEDFRIVDEKTVLCPAGHPWAIPSALALTHHPSGNDP